MSGREFGSAVTSLKSLDTKPLLRDNSDLLATLGEAHFYNGDLTSACTTLQRVTVVLLMCHFCHNHMVVVYLCKMFCVSNTVYLVKKKLLFFFIHFV